jgi:hypothetical protein
VTTITTEAASENGSTSADRASAEGSKHQTIRAVIKGLFKDAVKALTRHGDEDEPPQPRRRSGETDKGFVMAWRTMLHRAATKTGAAARGRYAALRPAKAALAKAEPEAVACVADPYTAATAYLSDTLDWLNLWQDNADNDHWLDDDFSAKEDRYFPQP